LWANQNIKFFFILGNFIIKKTSIKKYKQYIHFYYIFFYIHTKNYKNSKINKKYIKQFKIYKINPLKFRAVQGRLLALQEQWRRVSSTRRREHNLRDGWIWVVFSSFPLLHRRREVTSLAKPRKRNKQWFLFCFLLLIFAPDLFSSPCFFVLFFFSGRPGSWGRSVGGCRLELRVQPCVEEELL